MSSKFEFDSIFGVRMQKAVPDQADELARQARADLQRRLDETRERIIAEDARRKAATKPPPGFTPIPNSKHGGFHKQVGGKWVTWYPHTEHAQKIKALKIGDTHTDGRFEVTRKGRSSYVLFDGKDREHARWGDLHEITADMHHALDWDALPKGAGFEPHPLSGKSKQA